MSRLDVLLVDDDALFGLVLSDQLAADGFSVHHAQSLAEARPHLADVGIVILDHQLPDGVGFDLVEEIRRRGLSPKILLVTGNADLENAIEALRLGIEDYFTKPIELEQLRLAVHRCTRTLELERTEELERRRRSSERDRTVLVGSLAVGPIHQLIEKAAGARVPVLITGETGTGKSLVARAIHHAAPVGDGDERPLVSVNCGAIPETLLEAELFGAEKGAFTGAGATRRGLFELADGGTLFLDEIGELPIALQSKLLGALDDGRVRRLGGRDARQLDVRVVAATNVDPEAAIAAGSFRSDLFYRLNVVRIHVPALRERPDDVGPLVDSLLARIAPGVDARLADGEIDALRVYPWPGNVRELRNVLERSWLLDGPAPLRPTRLLGAGAREQPTADARSAVDVTSDGESFDEPTPRVAGDVESLADVERRHIEAAVALCPTQKEAAERLGIGVATLRRKLGAYRAADPSSTDR